MISSIPVTSLRDHRSRSTSFQVALEVESALCFSRAECFTVSAAAQIGMLAACGGPGGMHKLFMAPVCMGEQRALQWQASHGRCLGAPRVVLRHLRPHQHTTMMVSRVWASCVLSTNRDSRFADLLQHCIVIAIAFATCSMACTAPHELKSTRTPPQPDQSQVPRSATADAVMTRRWSPSLLRSTSNLHF